MKYVKTLAFAVAGLLVFAGPASATILTSPAGTQLGLGAEIQIESTHVEIRGAGGVIAITCEESKLAGNIGNAGGATETVEVALATLTFKNCKNGWAVNVGKPGKLVIHTDDPETVTGDGTVTSVGAEWTAENAGIGLHCIYTTNSTDIGEIDGSKNRMNGTAKLIVGATITRSGGRSGAFCGSTGEWAGLYTITKPDYLDVD